MAGKQGVVLEAGDDWAIILLPGGEYKRIRTKEHLQIGQLYHYKNSLAIKSVSVAAVLLLMVAAGLDFFTVTAWAHFSPGIELGINRWNRVVAVETTDSTLKIDNNALSLKGKNLNQAINLIVEEQVSQPQAEATFKSELSVSLSLKDKHDIKTKEKLLDQIESCLKASAAKKNDQSAARVVRNDHELKVVVETVNPVKTNKSNKQSKKDYNNFPKANKEQKLPQGAINNPPRADSWKKNQSAEKVKKESEKQLEKQFKDDNKKPALVNQKDNKKDGNKEKTEKNFRSGKYRKDKDNENKNTTSNHSKGKDKNKSD